ncbi:MAG: PRC-barrel domain-containing protein [Verrucomicrobia bacterium]|nr:PRC-barrel domain-containing protein [Verrucomicrobiota bacterium]
MTTRLLALTAGGLMAFALAWPALPGEPPPTPIDKEKTDTNKAVPEVTDTNKSSAWNKLSDLLAPGPQFGADKSTDLLGKTVRGSDNAKFGEFGDCLIDLPQGRIVAGLVKSGGLLGIGETVRAIPPTAFQYNETERTLTLNADKRTFHQTPAFKASQMDDVAQFVASYRQFGQEPYWSQGGTRQAVREAEPSAAPAVASAAPSNVRKATQIIGFTVRDSAQQELGEIRDLVLDLKSGHILYAVLAQGGILGVGDKLYPIPPQALSFADTGKALVLNMSRDQLERAPQFTKENWPGLSDPKWASDVYTYYHAPMYWLPAHMEKDKGATELMRQPVREAEDKPAKVETAPATSPLASKIVEALKADSALASVAESIEITAEGSVVTLKGTVDTEEQKEAVVKAAKNTDGVTEVDDQITVRK